ncbi:unnamed protein product [Owenia fusiformis]|uniref:Uncharacterized protein n=1 Tax=Owenia fusiformis TaxID=6347 RepID=A0A8J1UW20_OWEFU|nr:unnamed protein product [Owenia fusiformis]
MICATRQSSRVLRCLMLWPLCPKLRLYHQLTAQETQVALRPFYFAVHPDLFGQFPVERKVNEESLKKLSEHIQTIQTGGHTRQNTIAFYFRNIKQKNSGIFQRVEIKLKADLRETIVELLRMCGLSLEFIDSIQRNGNKSRIPRQMFGTSQWIREWEKQFHQEDAKENTKSHLGSWLQRNVPRAKENAINNQPIRKETEKLKRMLIEELGLIDIVWDSDWRYCHFIACLKSFYRLLAEQPVTMKALRGRCLIFTQVTGVSIHGNVLLGKEEVPHNWFKMITNIKQFRDIIEVIPTYEEMLSSYLNNVEIKQHSSDPHALLYLKQLQTLVGSLKKHHYDGDDPKLLGDWSYLQLVVESGAGPLSLSPSGQFSVPTSCPASLVIAFLMQNRNTAQERIHKQKLLNIEEKSIIEQCVYELELHSLKKENNISSADMIYCCRRLHKLYMSEMASNVQLLQGANINVSTYYAVQQDGTLTVPWNWTDL